MILVYPSESIQEVWLYHLGEGTELKVQSASLLRSVWGCALTKKKHILKKGTMEKFKTMGQVEKKRKKERRKNRKKK